MYTGITMFLDSGLGQLTLSHLLSRQLYQTRDKASEHLETRDKVTPSLRWSASRLLQLPVAVVNVLWRHTPAAICMVFDFTIRRTLPIIDYRDCT